MTSEHPSWMLRDANRDCRWSHSRFQRCWTRPRSTFPSIPCSKSFTGEAGEYGGHILIFVYVCTAFINRARYLYTLNTRVSKNTYRNTYWELLMLRSWCCKWMPTITGLKCEMWFHHRRDLAPTTPTKQGSEWEIQQIMWSNVKWWYKDIIRKQSSTFRYYISNTFLWPLKKVKCLHTTI